MTFEDELKQALRRQEPPADFTAKVLARCEQARTPKFFFWRVALAAAVLVLAVSIGFEQHQRQERGMAAKRQLILAMKIAGTKLEEVRDRVNESE